MYHSFVNDLLLLRGLLEALTCNRLILEDCTDTEREEDKLALQGSLSDFDTHVCSRSCARVHV